MAIAIDESFVEKMVSGPLCCGTGIMDGKPQILLCTQGEAEIDMLSGRLAQIHDRDEAYLQLFDPAIVDSSAVISIKDHTVGNSHTYSKGEAAMMYFMLMLRSMYPMTSQELIDHFKYYWQCPSFDKVHSTNYANYDSLFSDNKLKTANDLIRIQVSALGWMKILPAVHGWSWMTEDSSKRSCYTDHLRPVQMYKYIYGTGEDALIELNFKQQGNLTVAKGLPYWVPEGKKPFIFTGFCVMSPAHFHGEGTDPGTRNQSITEKKEGNCPNYITVSGSLPKSVFDLPLIKTGGGIPSSSDTLNDEWIVDDGENISYGKNVFPENNRVQYNPFSGKDESAKFARSFAGQQRQHYYMGLYTLMNKDGYALQDAVNQWQPNVGGEQVWAAVVSCALCELVGTDVLARLEDYIDNAADTSAVDHTSGVDCCVPIILAAWVPNEHSPGHYKPTNFLSFLGAGSQDQGGSDDLKQSTSIRTYCKGHTKSSGFVGRLLTSIRLTLDADIPTSWGASSLDYNLVVTQFPCDAFIDTIDRQADSSNPGVCVCRWSEQCHLDNDNVYDWKARMTKAHGPNLKGWKKQEYIVSERELDYRDEAGEATLELPIVSVHLPWGTKKQGSQVNDFWFSAFAYASLPHVKTIRRVAMANLLTLANFGAKDQRFQIMRLAFDSLESVRYADAAKIEFRFDKTSVPNKFKTEKFPIAEMEV